MMMSAAGFIRGTDAWSLTLQYQDTGLLISTIRSCTLQMTRPIIVHTLHPGENKAEEQGQYVMRAAAAVKVKYLPEG